MDAALLVPTWTSSPVDVRCPSDDVDALRSVLTQLSFEAKMSFRIEVGRAVAAALFDGAPTEPVRRAPQSGRVVTKFERASDELDGLSGCWAQVGAAKRRPAQVARVKAAVAGVEGADRTVGGGVGVSGRGESQQIQGTPKHNKLGAGASR